GRRDRARRHVRAGPGDSARPPRVPRAAEGRDRLEEGRGRARFVYQRHLDREEPEPGRPRGVIVPDEDRGGDPEEERPADGRIPAAGERIAYAPTPADGARQGTGRHGAERDQGRAG